jgi:hypothetical protein
MSSSDKRVHFGLGAETTIRTVEIAWPRGARQTLAGVKADRLIKVEEPLPARPPVGSGPRKRP